MGDGAAIRRFDYFDYFVNVLYWIPNHGTIVSREEYTMNAIKLRSGLSAPVLPTDAEARLARTSSRLLAAYMGHGETARLRVIDGDQGIIEIPVSALRLLIDILAQMAEGNGVTIMPVHAELTTQQAADFLNVSRPYLIDLLERKELPFHKVGTHRRVLFKDLLAYRERSRLDMDQALDQLAQQAQEHGLGY